MCLKLLANRLNPDFSLEDDYAGRVCGLDEVGRGPLAGPVVAACVYIPEDIRSAEWVNQVRDSKTISKQKLEALHDLIRTHCTTGIGACTVEEIDAINILQASLLAMERAYGACGSFDHALVDGNKLPRNLPCPATAVTKGDSISKSIAAASIIAKVTRDKIMAEAAQKYPGYGWESNAGYPSPAHKEALKTLGVTPFHRKSFAPVRAAIEAQVLAKAS